MNILELQRDLQRKYKNVGSKVEAIWRQFTPKQRETAMRETVGDGKVLRNSRDPGLGRLNEIIPEWNLEDITSSAEFFLERLKFRVEADLQLQHFEGVNGGPGDQEVIQAAARRLNPQRKELWGVFVRLDQTYGQWVKPNGADGLRRTEDFAARWKLILPSHEALPLIERQKNTFLYYNHLIEEILDMGSQSRAKKAVSKKPSKDAASALANLTIAPKPLKASISEVIAQAIEQKVAAEDYLHLLRREPLVLNQAVNRKYHSRPELVPDDRGRIMPLFTDKHISTALFDVLADAVKIIVTWDYISRLVRILDGLTDKVRRPLVLQELSNTCHLEYRRAQMAFRRQMSTSPGFAGRRFKRITVGDVSRVAIKGQPSDVTVSDPQLHYVLRLCHPDTNHRDAAQWIQKLDDHNNRHADDRVRLDGDQVSALGDLAIIVSFMHTLSTTIALVSGSKKSGLLFTGRTAKLDAELDQYKARADFGDHVVPMDNLLEPGVATNALQALHDFIIEQAGASVGILYEDMLQECLGDIEKKAVHAEARLEQGEKQTFVPLPSEEPGAKPTSFQVEQRREKAKTRPAEAIPAHDITAIAPQQEEAVAEPTPCSKVKSSTAAVFTTLFAKSEARGSVTWAAFAAAMTELGFSVTPKGGSVFTFNPPESMAEKGSLTLHRPHVSEI